MKLNDAENIMIGSKPVNRIYARNIKVWEREGINPDDWVYHIDNEEVRILGYKGSGTKVTIPSVIEGYPVTIIGSGESYEPLTGVGDVLELVIPSSVREIANYAFYSQVGVVKKIKRVNIGDNVQTIGNNAFENCYCLEYILIGNGVKEIGQSAFHRAGQSSEKGECTLILGENLEKIGNWAFAHCYHIRKLTITGSVKEIGIGAFEACNGLLEVVIPDSVEFIASQAFADCTQAKSLTLNNTITSIENRVFTSWWGLKEIYIPQQIEIIGKQAFYNSGLVTAFIPSSCTYYVDESNTYYNSFPYGTEIIRY
ncbi:MAG: leucine-rich repeat domain-containing protein [Clostridiales bacterium]|nr:leucine-rich repeat domain-containing protein [Clostridiales bacterium]